jgi:hypothetical protein
MPRKKVHRLSPKETDAVFRRLLANTQLAWQEREMAIMRVCQSLGFDHKDERQRHVAFGYLAHFAPPHLVPGLYPRAKKRKSTKIQDQDMRVLQLAALLLDKAKLFDAHEKKPLTESQLKKLLSKAVDMAIEALKLPAADRTTHKKRIMRKYALLLEEQFPCLVAGLVLCR